MDSRIRVLEKPEDSKFKGKKKFIKTIKGLESLLISDKEDGTQIRLKMKVKSKVNKLFY